MSAIELEDGSGRIRFKGTAVGGGGGGGGFTVADADPGATGPGSFWMDTVADPYVLNVRDELDAAWSPVATFPQEFTFGGTLSVQFQDGAMVLHIDDGAGAGFELVLGTTTVAVHPIGANTVLTLHANGAFQFAEPVNGFGVLEYDPTASTNVQTALAVNRGTDGATLFTIKGDGSMHGRTGKALTFDI